MKRTYVCQRCQASFERKPEATRPPPRFCSRKCANHGPRHREPKPVRRTVTWDKAKNIWRGRATVTGGLRVNVVGATKLEAEGKLALRLKGVPTGAVGSARYRKVSVETVRYALSLLLPLDHSLRFERQQQAVAILELAIRYAEVNLDASSQDEPSPIAAPAPPRHRPAWLDALPARQEAS